MQKHIFKKTDAIIWPSHMTNNPYISQPATGGQHSEGEGLKSLPAVAQQLDTFMAARTRTLVPYQIQNKGSISTSQLCMCEPQLDLIGVGKCWCMRRLNVPNVHFFWPPPKQCSINLCTASRRIHLHVIEHGHKIKFKKTDPDEAFMSFASSRWQCCSASRVTNQHGAGWLFIGFLLFLGWEKNPFHYNWASKADGDYFWQTDLLGAE